MRVRGAKQALLQGVEMETLGARQRLDLQMDTEKRIMLELARKGGVTIHNTPCMGLRECGEQGGDINSCHWSATHRWTCFRREPMAHPTNWQARRRFQRIRRLSHALIQIGVGGTYRVCLWWWFWLWLLPKLTVER
jgi:hypothetical protein